MVPNPIHTCFSNCRGRRCCIRYQGNKHRLQRRLEKAPYHTTLDPIPDHRSALHRHHHACRCRIGEQTSGSREPSTGVSAPYQVAVSAGSGSSLWGQLRASGDQPDLGSGGDPGRSPSLSLGTASSNLSSSSGESANSRSQRDQRYLGYYLASAWSAGCAGGCWGLEV